MFLETHATIDKIIAARPPKGRRDAARALYSGRVPPQDWPIPAYRLPDLRLPIATSVARDGTTCSAAPLPQRDVGRTADEEVAFAVPLSPEQHDGAAGFEVGAGGEGGDRSGMRVAAPPRSKSASRQHRVDHRIRWIGWSAGIRSSVDNVDNIAACTVWSPAPG